MSEVLAIRPFVPAKDFGLSKRFYQAMGFAVTLDDPPIAILKMQGFSFILQDFYVREQAETFMVQMLVRDVEAFWRGLDPDRLVAAFGVKPPRPPAMQPWGMKVGFLSDPSGVLWHVAEVLF